MSQRQLAGSAIRTLVSLFAVATAAQAEHAATVLDYDPGQASSLANPYAAVGAPAQTVGGGTAFPGIVSVFSPPYEATHLVQIHEGGTLTLRLSHAILVAAGQSELGVFTNAGLVDVDFPDGRTAPDLLATGTTFGIDSARIDVSENGKDWIPLGEHTFDIPTRAWTDAASPFQEDATGLAAADPGQPHSLALADFANRSHAEIQTLLGTSAGGNWIDLSPSGLVRVSYLRFRVEDDADPATARSFEIDAVAINNAAVGDPVLAGGLLLDEDFATNPIGTRAQSTGDASHFSWTPGQLDAAIDVSRPAARLVWPLTAPLDQTTSFRLNTVIELNNVEFTGFNACQLAFGLINQGTTGTTRTRSPADAWDQVTIDYFPGADLATLTPTVIPSDSGSGDALAQLEFPAGSASLINEPNEVSSLPQGDTLTLALEYDAASRTVTLRAAGLAINAFGPNPDGDPTTIQHALPPDVEFEVDAFAILNWNHADGGTADLRLNAVTVETGAESLDNYYCWADAELPGHILGRGPGQDPDGDGFPNLAEYALGLEPAINSRAGAPALIDGFLRYQINPDRDDVVVALRQSSDAVTWMDAVPLFVSASEGREFYRAPVGGPGRRRYLRLRIHRP